MPILDRLMLSEPLMEYLRSKVASGQYASEGEVIEESLWTTRELQENGGLVNDCEEEEELKRFELEVAKSYDECKADPSILMTLEEFDQALVQVRLERARRAA